MVHFRIFLRPFESSDVDIFAELFAADETPAGGSCPVGILVILLRMSSDVVQSPEDGFGDGWGCRQVYPLSSEPILVSDISQFDRISFRGGIREGSLHDRRLVLLSWVLERSLFLCCYSVLCFVTEKEGTLLEYFT